MPCLKKINFSVYILFIGFCLYFPAGKIYSQNFAWAGQIGSTYIDEGRSITTDDQGNIYTVGSFLFTVDFDFGPAVVNYTSPIGGDMYIAKYNSQGDLQWVKTIGGIYNMIAYQITIGTGNNLYITGVFADTIDFDPGPPIYNLASSTSSTDVFILKLDSAGNFIWAKQIGGTDNQWAYSITVDDEGNSCIYGQFEGTADFDPGPGAFNVSTIGFNDSYVCKLDINGNFIWVKRLESATTSFLPMGAVHFDSYGNVYCAGGFDGTNDFDPGPAVYNLTASGLLDVFLCKYDSLGNFIWAKKWGGGSADYIYSITTDELNNVYSVGSFNGFCDFDPGPGSTILNGSFDIFVSKLDASGNFLMAKKMGGSGIDVGFSISLDTNNNIYTTGSFVNTADFDPGAGTFNLASNGTTDIFISKLDSIGNFAWAKKIGSTGDDVGYSLKVHSSGEVYTTGSFRNTADFNTDPDTMNFTSAGNKDIFIHKLAPCTSLPSPPQPDSIIGSLVVCDGDLVSYAILPVTYATHYTWNLPSGWTGYSTSTSINVLPSANGTIYVVASNACGSSSPQTLSIVINDIPQQPSPILGDTAVCIGTSQDYSVLNDLSVTSYTWELPFGWMGSSLIESINTIPDTSGIISVTANNECGSSPPQTLTVTVSNPVMNLTTVPASCNDSCNGIILYNISGGIGGYTLVPFPLTDLCAGTYTVTAVDGIGCSTTDTTTIEEPLPLIVNFLTSDTTFCEGNCIDIITMVNGGTPSFSYEWLPGGNITSVSNINMCPTTSITYTCIVTDDHGCTQSTTTDITILPLPDVTANATDTIVCDGESVILTGGGADTYAWSGGVIDGMVFNPSTTATYTVTGSNTNACSDTAMITIHLYPLPTVDFVYSGADTMCISYGIQSLSGGAPAGGVYSGTGVTGNIFDPNVAGIGNNVITYTYTDSNSCSNNALVNITVLGCAIVDDNSFHSILVYPNPFSIHFVIQSEQLLNNATLTLFDMTGKQVLTIPNINSNSIQVDRNNLSSGMYFYSLTESSEIIKTGKIIAE